MGGAVSTGQDNDELIDNLLAADYIKTSMVERVFRAVDRGEYFLPKSRGNAYKDLAWKSGHLHISAPCIYSEVMEGLELKPGLSFLNLGSGTGYLSTMVGLVLGSSGINRGIELHEDVVQYANNKLTDFKRLSGAIDEYDFCEPQFVQGNCLCLISSGYRLYDRVYCGAAVPVKYEDYVKNLLKIGGILVMPLNDELLQVKRVSESRWDTRKLLPVSFATLIAPAPEEPQFIDNFEIQPPSLQCMCRTVVRNILRRNIEIEHPPIKRTIPPSNKAPKKKRALKKIVVPLFDSDTSDDETVVTLGRDRNAGRAMVAGLEAERAMNFVFGGGLGPRRGFLRSHRRPQNVFCVCLQTNNNNVSSSDANKTDESEPMEVEQESTEQQSNESSNVDKTVNDIETNINEELGGTVEKMEEDNTGTNGKQTNAEQNTNNNKSDNIGESKKEESTEKLESKASNAANCDTSNSSLEEGDPSFISVIHMPRSLSINGVMIANIQTFGSSSNAINESNQNANEPAEMDGVSTGDNNRDEKNDTNTQDNSEEPPAASQVEVNTSETHGKTSLDSGNEVICIKCDNRVREEATTSAKGKEAEKIGGNRKKFDSGLGDEIVESNIGNSSSDDEQNDDLPLQPPCDRDNEELVAEERPIRWIELDRNMSPDSSSEDEHEESVGHSDEHSDYHSQCNGEYHMYQTPYTGYMKGKIQKLPLPIMLKNFLHYHRDF